MPALIDVLPLVHKHYLSIQAYMEAPPNSKEMAQYYKRCLETEKKLMRLFKADPQTTQLAHYLVDVINLIEKNTVQHAHQKPGLPFDQAFTEILIRHVSTMGMNERLIFRYANQLNDHSDPVITSFSELFNLLFRTFFKTLKLIGTFPFDKKAYTTYRVYLDDAWGVNHHLALSELDAIFKEPLHANVNLPPERPYQSPIAHPPHRPSHLATRTVAKKPHISVSTSPPSTLD